MDTGIQPYLWLALLWTGYFLIHSALASLRLKHWISRHHPRLMPAYRLIYNALAVLLALPPLWMIWQLQGDYLWRWQGTAFWVANGFSLLVLAGFAWSARYYDSSEFLGLRQWRARERRVEDQEGFHISPLHRHVRHPWYSLGLLLIWGRDMDKAWLVSCCLISLYLVIGSRLEERKLIAYHGEAYREYRRRVPGLIPLPWRRLSPREADELVALARERN